MITTKNIELPKVQDLSSEYIEQELANLNIEPLRWAIVKVTDSHYVLTVSFEV